MPEARHYTFLSLLGEGGFGKVYRARLTAGGGFSKEVAVKMLSSDAPSDELLQRFRDEARILALLRDRAIVSVDPPTRIAGRWAVVMDYVDGASIAALLQYGPVPCGVALEIVGEIARLLDKAFNFPGPTGLPLELLHRDIKPANVQVTSSGEVRLLDFGVARARFDSREAKTTSAISGTPGYMAPERLIGIEVPAGDIYSLGVLLWTMVTGGKNKLPAVDVSNHIPAIAGNDLALARVLRLAAAMRNPDHEERPTARDVERECQAMRYRLPPPFLREWAEQIEVSGGKLDELCGSVLSETVQHTRADVGDLTVETRTNTLLVMGGLATASTGLLVAGGVTLFALLLGGGYWLYGPGSSLPPSGIDAETTPPPPEPRPSPIGDADAPSEQPKEPAAPIPEPAPAPQEPEPAPAPQEPEPTPPAPKAPEPRPTPVDPAPTVPSPPQPSASTERPAPRAPVATFPLDLRSKPWGATVWLDGHKLPATAPVLQHPVTEGTHRVRMRIGDHESTQTIQVGPDEANVYTWTSEPDGWQAFRR